MPTTYRNLTCVSCGKKMTKSIKPQGEAKCRPCLQPNAKVKELTCKHCKNTFESIVHADYCSNLCHSRDYDRAGYSCSDCGVSVVRGAVRCKPCAAQEISLRDLEERTQVKLKKQAHKELMARFVKPKVIRIGKCEGCSTYWSTMDATNRKLCSICSLTRLKARMRAGKARRRARMAGVYTEAFKVEEVYERDNNICLICFEPMDMSAVVPDFKAPTIDHIKPISLGGEHTKRNVRSAHFICNATRGNDYDELIDIPID